MCVQGMISKVLKLYLRYPCEGNVLLLLLSPCFILSCLSEQYGFDTQHIMCLTNSYRIPDVQVVSPW